MKSAKHSSFRYDLKQSNIFWKWFSCTSVTKSKVLNRRTFLRGTRVCLALPMLDAMRPAFSAEKVSTLPRRDWNQHGHTSTIFLSRESWSRLQIVPISRKTCPVTGAVHSVLWHKPSRCNRGPCCRKMLFNRDSLSGKRWLPQLDIPWSVCGRAIK